MDENDKRFFVIMFTGLTDKKEVQEGKMHMFTDGSYVNEQFIHTTINKDFGLTSPFIMNIIEMEMEDFADFTASEEEYREIPIDEKKPTNNDLDEFI